MVKIPCCECGKLRNSKDMGSLIIGYHNPVRQDKTVYKFCANCFHGKYKEAKKVLEVLWNCTNATEK